MYNMYNMYTVHCTNAKSPIVSVWLLVYTLNNNMFTVCVSLQADLHMWENHEWGLPVRNLYMSHVGHPAVPNKKVLKKNCKPVEMHEE